MKSSISISVAGLLLLILFVVWLDIESLAWFDIVLLVAVSACVCLAIGTKHRWLKAFVGALLLMGTLIITQSLEPVLRSLSNRPHSNQEAYNDGIRAYYNTIRSYRPFTLLAAGGLFLILVSAGKGAKNER
jgi:uncharacterized membrane protein YphA (DoxX/SURF4 family)